MSLLLTQNLERVARITKPDFDFVIIQVFGLADYNDRDMHIPNNQIFAPSTLFKVGRHFLPFVGKLVYYWSHLANIGKLNYIGANQLRYGNKILSFVDFV